jgi:hypothetical protein
MQRAAITFAKSALTPSSGATPASRFPAPVSGWAKTILDTYGRGLLTRLTAISRPSVSSRMSPGTFAWDSAPSEEISKTEATGLRRAYSRRLRRALLTSGSGCSSSRWQTPAREQFSKRRQVGQTERSESLLPDQAAQWPTPNVPNRGKELDKSHRADSGGIDLQSTVETWENFPTGRPDPETPPAGDGCLNAGPDSRPLWSTPTGKITPNTDTPDDVVNQQPKGKRLNPAFVSWLMNFPHGWTSGESINLELWAMQSSRRLRRWLSSVCQRNF